MRDFLMQNGTEIPEVSDMWNDDTLLAIKDKLLTGIKLQFATKPVLVKLAAMLDEALCLAIPSGEQMLVVYMVPSSRPNELSSMVGRRYSLSLSITDEGCTEDSETEFCMAFPAVGNHCIASRMIKVPLWNGQQKVCGWLCLIGLAERLTAKRLRELLPVLSEEGEALSFTLSKGW